MDSSPVQFQVLELSPRNLRGAALRRSYARSPNQALFWRVKRAVVTATLTAGILPTGLLLLRLWRYAAHHRFRAGELVQWLRASGCIMPRGRPPGVVERLRPSAVLLAAGMAWATGTTCAVIIAGSALLRLPSGLDGPRDDPRASPVALAGVALLTASSFLQILAILVLRLRVERFIQRLSLAAVSLGPVRAAPELPVWVLWPMTLIVPWAAVWLGGYRWAAIWAVPAVFAVLASEVQRGYITVTDRRLRYALARRIGFLLNGEGRSGR